MTHQNFLHRFVNTPLMKYGMTFERMIQAHNFFCHFPGIMKKVSRLQIIGTCIRVQILQ
jgi:hypothetical protein